MTSDIHLKYERDVCDRVVLKTSQIKCDLLSLYVNHNVRITGIDNTRRTSPKDIYVIRMSG